jgi:hypothetical protein
MKVKINKGECGRIVSEWMNKGGHAFPDYITVEAEVVQEDAPSVQPLQVVEWIKKYARRVCGNTIAGHFEVECCKNTDGNKHTCGRYLSTPAQIDEFDLSYHYKADQEYMVRGADLIAISDTLKAVVRHLNGDRT